MSIEKSYDLWAKQYDVNDNKTRDLDKTATIETLKKCSFDKVLELGCGTGKNTVFLLEKAQMVVGLDFSKEMLAIAQEKICDQRVHFQKADLNEPWPKMETDFDLITSSLTLEHIEDLQHIFQQAQQKLRKGGLFFISEFHPFKQYMGRKARFETDKGLYTLEAYTHHFSEYLTAATTNGLQLIELQEWFDEGGATGIPRLISFVFRKNH